MFAGKLFVILFLTVSYILLCFVHSIYHVFDYLLVCNYTLTPPSYQFSSPGYPSSYPHNAYCEYHFIVPEDRAVRICYNQFSLESSSSCTYDSMKLYEKGILKATYCGYKSDFSWNSKESQVLMTFKSDALATSYGFYGSFSLTSKRKSLVQNSHMFKLYNSRFNVC